jgi:hypothetical protein
LENKCGPCCGYTCITRGAVSSERIATRSSEEYRRSACEDLKCDLKTLFMCNTWSVQSSETVIVPVLRSVARRRLVKTGNPSACAAVNWISDSAVLPVFKCD